MKLNANLGAAALLPALLLSACSHIDHAQTLENAELWRKVSDKPLTYVPRDWPKGEATEGRGEWVADVRDGTRYFVPRGECGGRTSGVWRGEAMKSTNSTTAAEDRQMLIEGVLMLPLAVSVTAVKALPYMLAGAGGGAGP